MRKNIFKYKITTALIVTIITSSCTKFLEETSPDIVIPTKVTHYEELLFGAGYPIAQTNATEFLSDDVEYAFVSNSSQLYENTTNHSLFSYIRNPDDLEKDKLLPLWNRSYEAISINNIVIDAMKNMDASEINRNHVLGQAYLLRAFNYFNLMGWFGAPYGWSDKDDYGVPISLTAEGVDRSYPRQKASEVYQLIKKDIEAGLPLINKDVKSFNPFELNYLGALGLANRMYLYMEDYDQVIQYGDDFLKLHNVKVNTTQDWFKGTNYISAVNKENVFIFGGLIGEVTTPLVNSSVLSRSDFRISTELLELFSKDLNAGQNDERFTWWVINKNTAGRQPYVKKSDGSSAKRHSIRTGEILLNMAEAYYHKGDQNNAIHYLNQIKESRISNYTPLKAGEIAAEKLLQLIKDERRKELVLEGVRWLDLRRYKEGVTHTIEGINGKSNIELGAEDWLFILQVPRKETDKNKLISIVPGESAVPKLIP